MCTRLVPSIKRWTVGGRVIEYVLARADLQPGQHVLDLGTGSGSVALAAAVQLGSAGRVTGGDLSPEMLAKARARARNRSSKPVVSRYIPA